MPANLPPQYYKLEKEFHQETDPREKLRLARELLAIMPKHKGTDKLQADMKSKIAKLKEQVESGGARHGAHRTDPHTHIEREGAAQIVLVGAPNAGKSSLLDLLTDAHPHIADYPFTTREPLAGMFTWETVHFQLVDTPPVSAEHMEPYIPNLVREADVVVLVLDVSSPRWDRDVEEIRARLLDKHIVLAPQDPPETADPMFLYKCTLFAAHKHDEALGADTLSRLAMVAPGHTVVPTSVLDDACGNALGAAIFGTLGMIRVYTKRVGHEVEYVDPLVLPVGATVEDAARLIHKDFAQKLQFARVWGHGKFEGQRVTSSFALSDRDVVEYHI
jgi:ribosome-interacting GTPase 1